MANITITSIDDRTPVWKDAVVNAGVLTLGAADTILEETILAMDSVSLKYVIFVKGGSTNENGIPKGILAQDLTVTGSGDSPVRVNVAGEFIKERLIIDADGDDSNIDNAVINQLRDYGMIPRFVDDLNIADNV